VRELNAQTKNNFVLGISGLQAVKYSMFFKTQKKHERLEKLDTLFKNPSSHFDYS